MLQVSPVRVSVLMAVFNENGDYLSQAIDSILQQTFRDWEFVIIDDGSDRPETLEKLRLYSCLDSRIKLYSVRHGGLTASLNFGLFKSIGEYICRQDSDDWSDRRRIERQVVFMDKHPEIAVVGCDYYLHMEDGSLLWVNELPRDAENVLKSFRYQNPFCHGATFFRKSAGEQVGGYRNIFTCSQDYDFFWRICEKFGGANLPMALYHHRRTSCSVSTIKNCEQARVAHITRLLAKMRSANVQEDIIACITEVDSLMESNISNPAEQVLKRGDNMLLAGHYVKALTVYLEGISVNVTKATGYFKLLRWAVFILCPFVRKRLFNVPIFRNRELV